MKNLKDFIRDIPNFPREGIIFKDITPLWGDPHAFSASIDVIVSHFKRKQIDIVMGVEARGFIVGSPVAYKLGTGFIPVRKPGKLPYKTASITYELEYGTDTIEMHEDAIKPGQNVLIVDDLLATGGTAKAMTQLVESKDAKVAGLAFIVELTFLNGRERLDRYEILSLIKY
jgi:adenine phosphoribosyltransferase